MTRCGSAPRSCRILAVVVWILATSAFQGVTGFQQVGFATINQGFPRHTQALKPKERVSSTSSKTKLRRRRSPIDYRFSFERIVWPHQAVQVDRDRDASAGSSYLPMQDKTEHLQSSHSAVLTKVPTQFTEALQVFFFSGDCGPSFIVLLLLGMVQWRLHVMSTAVTGMDALMFGASIVFWWFQEYFLHDKVLHSHHDWIGKAIHQGHHDKPYYHISIDPALLLLGWLAIAHVLLFRWWLPLPLALSATLGYTCAGLFYEWAHYIVHTKVRFQGWGSQFWTKVRDNHIRHHRICSDYWYAFSVPWMDDLLHTNRSVQDVQHELRQNRKID